MRILKNEHNKEKAIFRSPVMIFFIACLQQVYYSSCKLLISYHFHQIENRFLFSLRTLHLCEIIFIIDEQLLIFNNLQFININEHFSHKICVTWVIKMETCKYWELTVLNLKSLIINYLWLLPITKKFNNKVRNILKENIP